MPTTQSPSARLATQVWACTAALLGVAMIVLDPVRFQGPAWLAFQYLPYWPKPMGFLLLIIAAIMLTGDASGHYRTRNLGITSFQVVCLGWVGAFTYAALYQPSAGVTGIIIYTAVAVQLQIVRRLRRKDTGHDAASR